MKKTFEFSADEEGYMLKNTNPSENLEAFKINKKDMQFDTNKFYQYVFSDVALEMSIDIINKVDEDDKLGKRLFDIILEISSGVMEKLKERAVLD